MSSLISSLRQGRVAFSIHGALTVAFLLANAFSGTWHYMGIPAPIDRGLLALLIIFLLIDERAALRERCAFTILNGLMLFVVVWTTISAHFAETLTTSIGLYALLDRIIVPYALFTFAPVLLPRAADRRLLTLGLCFLGAYLGFTALLEMLGGRSYVVPAFIVNDELGIHPDRARGPFLAAEANGMVLTVCAFAGFIEAERRSGIQRLLAGAVVILSLTGALLCMTRSVWLGAAIGVIIASVLNREIRKIAVVVSIAGTIAAIGAIAASPGLRQLIVDRFTTQRSLDDRANTNLAALKALSENPFFGIGWAKFHSIGTEWVRLSDDFPITNVGIEVHNVPLARLAELGVFGGSAWSLVVLLGPMWALVKYRTSAPPSVYLLAVTTVAVWVFPTMFSPNPYPLPNNLFWLLTGLLAIPGEAPVDQEALSEPPEGDYV